MFEFERTASPSGALPQASRGKLMAMLTRTTGPAGAVTDRVPSEDSQSRLEGSSAARDDPFDAWLRRHLRQSYGATMAEPIPVELLRLIEDGGKGR